MAKVSQKERDEAAGFIRQALRNKLSQLKEDNAAVLDDMRQKAETDVEKRFGVKATLREIQSLRDQATQMEKSLYEKIGTRAAGQFIANHERDKFTALLEKSRVGKEMDKLEEKMSNVGREVFLATGHEDLVALVREATK